jgi:hypothetical protein
VEHGKKLMPYKQPEVDIEEDKTTGGSNLFFFKKKRN